jgi:hypothetical protein
MINASTLALSVSRAALVLSDLAASAVLALYESAASITPLLSLSRTSSSFATTSLCQTHLVKPKHHCDTISGNLKFIYRTGFDEKPRYPALVDFQLVT